MQSLRGDIECGVSYDMLEAIWDMLIVKIVPILCLPYFLQANQVGVRDFSQLFYFFGLCVLYKCFHQSSFAVLNLLVRKGVLCRLKSQLVLWAMDNLLFESGRSVHEVVLAAGNIIFYDTHFDAIKAGIGIGSK